MAGEKVHSSQWRSPVSERSIRTYATTIITDVFPVSIQPTYCLFGRANPSSPGVENIKLTCCLE